MNCIIDIFPVSLRCSNIYILDMHIDIQIDPFDKLYDN